MKKLSKISLAMVAAAAVAMPMEIGAVRAIPGIISVPQPDGTELAISIHGDEYSHYTTTADGYLLTGNADGTYSYVAGIDAQGRMINSGIRAVNASERSAEATAYLQKLDKEATVKEFVKSQPKAAISERGVSAKRVQAAPNRLPGGSQMLFSDVPTVGELPGLVILVEYQDIKFKVDNPGDYFKRMMNEKGFSDNGSYGSARDYFLDSSRGQYIPEFDVYGPVTLKHNSSYYAGSDGTARAYEMAAEALKALDPDVDFSIFDTDGDGYIDNVTVIYAGQGQASGGGTNTVWPHSWNASSAITVKVDGVRYDRYCCLNEWVNYRSDITGKVLNRPDGIGTFCHEFSHVLGLPDLYDINYRHTNTPNDWSIMDSGPYNGDGCFPPIHSIYEAYCLGWCEPEEISGAMNGVLDGSGSLQGYYIATDKSNEFFMFESRETGYSWDKYIPASGMLVWHVDYSKSKWDNNSVNTQSTHPCVQLVAADNAYGDRTLDGDAFPGIYDDATEFTYSTRPAFRSWSGYNMELPITDITRLDARGAIKFKVAGGVEDVDPLANVDAGVKGSLVTISWDAPAMAPAGRAGGIEGYEVNIYNEDEGVFEYGKRCIQVPANETSLEVELQPMTNYSACVRLVTDKTRSDWSQNVVFTTKSAGIENITGDSASDAPAEYFNLQGIRVNNPAPGTIVIRRQGEKSTKEIF